MGGALNTYIHLHTLLFKLKIGYYLTTEWTYVNLYQQKYENGSLCVGCFIGCFLLCCYAVHKVLLWSIISLGFTVRLWCNCLWKVIAQLFITSKKDRLCAKWVVILALADTPIILNSLWTIKYNKEIWICPNEHAKHESRPAVMTGGGCGNHPS